MEIFLIITINSLKIINIRPQTLCSLFETSHHQLDSVPPLRLIQPLMCVQGNLIGHVIVRQTFLQVGGHTRHSAFVWKCAHLSSQGLCEHKDVSHYCTVWDDELVRLQYYWLEEEKNLSKVKWHHLSTWQIVVATPPIVHQGFITV